MFSLWIFAWGTHVLNLSCSNLILFTHARTMPIVYTYCRVSTRILSLNTDLFICFFLKFFWLLERTCMFLPLRSKYVFSKKIIAKCCVRCLYDQHLFEETTLRTHLKPELSATYAREVVILLRFSKDTYFYCNFGFTYTECFCRECLWECW